MMLDSADFLTRSLFVSSGRPEMIDVHPSPRDFETFLRGTPASVRHDGTSQIIRHLLGDCAVCRERLSTLGWSKERLGRLLQAGTDDGISPETFAKPAYDYSTAFTRADRAVAAFLTPEPAMAAATVEMLLEDLEALPADEQVQQIETGHFARPALVRLLVDRSHRARYKDTGQMLQLADLARLAAESCSFDSTGNEMKLADLRARAWGQYGNALRVSGRPREAEQALTTAQEYRQSGTGDPLLQAWLIEVTAPLLVFQGNFRTAIEVCDEAEQICQALGETHLLSVAMLQKAIAALYSGEAEQAVRVLTKAIPLIDNEADSHLLFAACHNLISCYIELDRPDYALMLYDEARELYQEFNDPLLLLRATWQEGRLLRDLGHLRGAETALLRARKGYQEGKLIYEVALVSLDLASVYVKLGRVEEVKRTVMTTVPIFHALRAKVETLAALLQLQQVADQEQQALELIRALNARVESLKNKMGQ
jgi:tetratricopeptide (TPR) repeat protein